jgi:hypothetical protein
MLLQSETEEKARQPETKHADIDLQRETEEKAR